MPNVAPAASWAITMGKSIYVTGDTITATEFGPRTGGASVVVRLQITMTVPTLGTLSVIDIGADSSFTLPANTRVNFGPLPLITVNSTFPPRGQWSLDSKVTNPTTGALIDQDLNPFVIQ